MALAGTEWIIVGALIVFLFFLLRPRAITDMAKSIGQVAAEFKKGERGSERTKKAPDLLSETAERLGIATEGKSSSQIREEILARTSRRN